MIAKYFIFLVILSILLVGCKNISEKNYVTETVELCEIENPSFNPYKECQGVISEKYPNMQCNFTFGPTDWQPFGSCRNCTIICS